MKKSTKIIVTIVLSVVAVALFVFGFAIWSLERLIHSYSIYIVEPQEQNWQAVFLYHGFLMSSTITLVFVPELNNTDSSVVAGPVYFADSPPSLFDAYRSADGSVLAVRTDAVQSEERLGFTYAYDFQNKKLTAPPEHWYSKMEYDDERLKEYKIQIEKLLEERGGRGKCCVESLDMLTFHSPGKEKNKWDEIHKKVKDYYRNN